MTIGGVGGGRSRGTEAWSPAGHSGAAQVNQGFQETRIFSTEASQGLVYRNTNNTNKVNFKKPSTFMYDKHVISN